MKVRAILIRGRNLPAFTIAMFAIFIVAAVDSSARGSKSSYFRFEEFAESQLFLEENATDGDLGVHFKVDGEPWNRVILFDSRWRKLVDVRVTGNSRVIGLTELFNESAEPSFDDLPREDFLKLFPEGEYRFYGRMVDGGWLGGLAELTHTMPEQPTILSPEEGEEIDVSEPLTVEWKPIPDPAGSEIVNIIVVVEKDEDGERTRVVSADMDPSATQFTLAPGFLEPGKDYKVELLAEETTGNKIISEQEFETEE